MNENDVKKVQDENRELLMRKNQDYGSKNIEITGVSGVAVRMQDKVSRILNLTSKGEDANFESLRDTFGDLANYGTIGQMLLDGTFGDSGGFDGVESYFGPSEPEKVEEEKTEFEIPEQRGMIYLGGPIDNVTWGQALGWRETASTLLAEKGLASFNPAAAVTNGNADREAVENICISVIEHCAAVIAYLPSGQPAFGTIVEMTLARQMGKLVVIVSDWAGRSVFSRGFIVVPSIHDAIEALDERIGTW